MLAVTNFQVSLVSAAHACRIFMLHNVFYCAKVKFYYYYYWFSQKTRLIQKARPIGVQPYR